MKGKNSSLLLKLVPVLLLSGCAWFGGGDKKEGEKLEVTSLQTASNLPKGVLAVWSDGSTLLTQKEFDELLAFTIKQQPELQGLADAFMPMLKSQLFNALIQHRIIAKWVKDSKTDQSDEYKKMFENMLMAITQKVNVDFFAKQFEYKPTAKDVKQYFEENKDRVALISKGGVKAVGVKFEKEEDADAFLAKAKAKIEDFNKLVEADEKLSKNMQDFYYVNPDSRQMAKKLKDSIMAIKKFPSVEKIKVSDKTFWVVNADEKKDSEYRKFDEIKKDLENAVKQTKQGEAVMKKLEELKTKYGIKIKENAFAPPKPAAGKFPPAAPQKKMSPKGKDKLVEASEAPERPTKAA